MISLGLSLTDEQRARLREELKGNTRGNVYRRAAALLAIHKGSTVIQVAELLGVTRQSVYNWIATYGKADRTLNLADGVRSGRPSIWTAELVACLEQAVTHPPSHAGCTAAEWTVGLLGRHLAALSGRQISEAALRRRLRLLGYVTKRKRIARRLQPGIQALSLAQASNAVRLELEDARLCA